jgi:hypothetical protein
MHRHDHISTANLIIYQNGVFFVGIKLSNKFPIRITSLSTNRKQFKLVLKEFFSSLTSYYVDEFLNLT